MIDVIFAKENIIKPEIHLAKEERGVFFFRLSFEANEPVSNVQFSLLLPMKGLLSTFQATYDRVPHIFQWWASYSFPSTFYNGAPFLTVCDKEKVYANVALSDAINDTQIRFAVNDFDEDEKIAFVITLLSGRKACTSYEVDIRVDTRPLALEESMKSLSDWWLDYYPVQKELPRAAEEPLYSTWYNFHQHPNAQALVPELTLAKKLGFKTVILDDGWQFDGNGTGDYINCGDWAFSKEKFPNGLKEIKELDLKLAMWFCVPFVGWNTSAYKSLKINCSIILTIIIVEFWMSAIRNAVPSS